MEPKIAANSQTPPAFQNEQGPETDLWEPPFERWLRLADILLGNSPIPGQSRYYPQN